MHDALASCCYFIHVTCTFMSHVVCGCRGDHHHPGDCRHHLGFRLQRHNRKFVIITVAGTINI